MNYRKSFEVINKETVHGIERSSRSPPWSLNILVPPSLMIYMFINGYVFGRTTFFIRFSAMRQNNMLIDKVRSAVKVKLRKED